MSDPKKVDPTAVPPTEPSTKKRDLDENDLAQVGGGAAAAPTPFKSGYKQKL